METEVSKSSPLFSVAIAIIAFVIVVMVFCNLIGSPEWVTYSEQPKSPAQARMRDGSSGVNALLEAEISESNAGRIDMNFQARVVTMENEAVLPSFDSPHTAKHKTYQDVIKAIKSWLAYNTACGHGVTVHVKLDTAFTPPVEEVLTACWHMGGNPTESGFVIVDPQTGVGITGFVAPTHQLCWWLRRDSYQPNTAPACLLLGK